MALQQLSQTYRLGTRLHACAQGGCLRYRLPFGHAGGSYRGRAQMPLVRTALFSQLGSD